MNIPRQLALGIVALCAASAASAGVLDRIGAGGTLVIAHRESSVPFSYIDTKTGRPVGYAIDLCLRLAEVVRKKTGKPNMAVEFRQVTAVDRVAVIEQGKADLECGSTTNNAERRQSVAFTVPHFVASARLLVRKSSAVERLEDLRGKKLVSTKGTSPLKVVSVANRDSMMGITILEAPDHASAVEMVEKGQADAFAMDDVLLYGLAAGRPDPTAFKVVGRPLTTEPLAIMLPKGDPEFKQLIDAEMKRLINSREIYPLYDIWFSKPIPPGITLNLPLGYLLRDSWKYPSADVLL